MSQRGMQKRKCHFDSLLLICLLQLGTMLNSLLVLLGLLILQQRTQSFSKAWQQPTTSFFCRKQHACNVGRNNLRLPASTSEQTTTATAAPTAPDSAGFKDYVVALRNRLYAVDEQIWLHEYAKTHYSDKVKPMSQERLSYYGRLRKALLYEHPLARLYTDFNDAKRYNLSYAAQALDGHIEQVLRSVPMPLTHVNQIAVTSFGGGVINLMHSQGSIYQRLLPTKVSLSSKEKRQFQFPTFSDSGNYIAYVEVYFDLVANGAAGTPPKETFSKAHILVFKVEQNPRKYGNTDLAPIYDSGELPGAPFFIRFSPNEEQLIVLSTDMNVSSSSYGENVVTMLPWKFCYGKDETVQARMRGIRSSSALNSKFNSMLQLQTMRLLEGNSVFFTFTTSSTKNATLVAHIEKRLPPSEEYPTGCVEEGVYMQGVIEGRGVVDSYWKPIINATYREDDKVSIRWSSPQCHSAGGGDSVLLVENGFLVTKALSRYKRYEHILGDIERYVDLQGERVLDIYPSKQLKKVRGQVHFAVSPDHSRFVVLEEDFNVGHYSLVTIDGEQFLDPLDDATPTFPSAPTTIGDRIITAFWFSPDSSKLLCLTSANRRLSDLMREKKGFSVGLNAPMTWFVYCFTSKQWREYDTFQPTPYFMKTYVPFFSMYAQVTHFYTEQFYNRLTF